jgi:hypothetical protein
VGYTTTTTEDVMTKAKKRTTTTVSPRLYRQGDVLLVAVTADLPPEAQLVAREHGRVILAHGEATGHAHAIDHEAAELWALPDTRRFLRLPCEGIALLHEEHAPIPLPAGLYEVRRQREYTPERIRTVTD